MSIDDHIGLLAISESPYYPGSSQSPSSQASSLYSPLSDHSLPEMDGPLYGFPAIASYSPKDYTLPATAGWFDPRHTAAGHPVSFGSYVVDRSTRVDECISPRSYISESGRTFATISELDTLPKAVNSPFLDGTTFPIDRCSHGLSHVDFVDLSYPMARNRGLPPARTSSKDTEPYHTALLSGATPLPWHGHPRRTPSNFLMATGYPSVDPMATYPRRQEATLVDPIAEDFSAFVDLSAGDSDPTNRLAKSWNIVDRSTATASLSETLKQTQRRTSNLLPGELDEGRNRTDPLYSRAISADGLYHCAFEGRDECNHKPTKLKCNYDKFIDSHLRPFRCKMATCVSLSFSSTACLLRHEREMHGLHGHGLTPYLCLYSGCERSEANRGFPRQYNLRDHMRRVHAWHEPADDETPKKTVRRRKTATSKTAISSQRRKGVDSMQSDKTGSRVANTLTDVTHFQDNYWPQERLY